jgi:hypothetical protein
MNYKEQKDITVKVEQAREEIERLREQQAALEREKAALEDLRSRQAEWERGKKEVGETLERGLRVLEKEEEEVSRMTELVTHEKTAFRAILDDLADIKEETWSSESLKEELQKALLIVERGRKEYGKARARIPVLDGRRTEEEPVQKVEMSDPLVGMARLSAGDLVRVGFWIAVPLAIMVLFILFVVSIL